MEYEIVYSDKFNEDIEEHKKGGKKSILQKIDILIDELREHLTTGTGKPGPLKGGRKGQWSRRITQKHRLIYEIQSDVVAVLLMAALSHYDEK